MFYTEYHITDRHITLLIDYCVNYYCGLLFNIGSECLME